MKRNAVTLLEVMFSIGIVSVGILGVLTMLALSGQRASAGAAADAADRVGRNAVRQVDILGLQDSFGDRGRWAAVPANGQGYCLDPLGVASLGTGSPFGWFPAFDPMAVAGPRMHRISVRQFPGNQFFLPAPPINLVMARSWFRAEDDLVVSLPGDRTLPPVGYVGSTESRSSNGDWSWFATFQSGDYLNGEALMHVVVCRKRDPASADERLLDVERIDDHEFKLACRPGRPGADLEVREGEWVLLCGHRDGRLLFDWHRVDATQDVVVAGSPDFDGSVSAVDTRWVSTFGRDWSPAAANTQVAIFGYVVAVYEKTVRCNGGL